MTTAAMPGQQYDARAEARELVLQRDVPVGALAAITAALQRAHDAGAAGVLARVEKFRAVLMRVSASAKLEPLLIGVGDHEEPNGFMCPSCGSQYPDAGRCTFPDCDAAVAADALEALA